MLKKKRAQHVKLVRRELRLELGFSNRLVSEGWRALTGIEPHDDVRGVVASLAMSSMAIYDALVQLVASGHDEPALMVWRPMFERMLTAHWSERHPELAQQRFEELHRHTQLRSNRIAVGMPSLPHGQVPFPPAEPGEEERLNSIFGEYGTRGVTGRPMHKLVEEMAKDLDQFQAGNLLGCYRTAYLQSNQVLHATSSIFGNREGEFLSELAGTSTAIESCRFTLFYAYWTLMRVVQTVSVQLHPDCAASLLRLEGEGWSLFNDAIGAQTESLAGAVKTRLAIDGMIDQAKAARSHLAEVDRDGPCPCGSGTPYGDCHREYHILIEPWAEVPKYGDTVLLRPDRFAEGTVDDVK